MHFQNIITKLLIDFRPTSYYYLQINHSGMFFLDNFSHSISYHCWHLSQQTHKHSSLNSSMSFAFVPFLLPFQYPFLICFLPFLCFFFYSFKSVMQQVLSLIAPFFLCFMGALFAACGITRNSSSTSSEVRVELSNCIS